MKKTLHLGLFLIVLFTGAYSWIISKHGEKASTSSLKQQPYEPTLADLPPEHINKAKSCNEISTLGKKIQEENFSNANDYKSFYLTLSRDPLFLRIEKLSLTDSKCGAEAASFLVNLYSNIAMPEQANKYHQRTLNYANNNNSAAIEDLCTGYDSLAMKEDKLKYCKIIFNNKSKNYSDDVTFLAYYELKQIYYDTKQGNELFQLCLQASKYTKECLFSDSVPSANMLASNLYATNDYFEAFDLLISIAPHDETCMSYSTIGDMYLRGEGVKQNPLSAIHFYNLALKRICGHDAKAAILTNMGIAYETQLDHFPAFQYYHRAAVEGSTAAQLNLSIMYMRGYGTVQDNQKAYAWLSIAISMGLGDKGRQTEAEKIKRLIEYNLKIQNKDDMALKDAQALAKAYYQKYVLHEKSTTVYNNKPWQKLKTAWNVLTS